MTNAVTASPSRWARFKNSDIVYYFLRDKVAMFSFAVFVVFVLAALLAPWLAPHNVYDQTSFDLMDAELPPSWLEGGEARFWLGTDNQGRDIWSTILYGARISLTIGLFAVGLQLVLGIVIGLMAGYFGGRIDNLLGWESGFITWDGILHLVLPAVSLSSIMLPLFIRLVRSEMLEQLSSEYVKFARAKGLDNNKVYYQHALKNTMLPVITVGGVQIGTMVAYTILTESVFQWPGTGFLFLEAIHRVDTPLITAYVIFVGLIFVVTNTLVDLLYGFINPTVNLTAKG